MYRLPVVECEPRRIGISRMWTVQYQALSSASINQVVIAPIVFAPVGIALIGFASIGFALVVIARSDSDEAIPQKWG
jgi:hypothetical protein